MSKLAGLFAATLLACTLSAQNVVINEIYTGDPDMFEIANLSSTTQDLSGWTLAASFGFQVYAVYTFPFGTTLQPGACLVVIEAQSALPLSSPLPPAGTTILNTGINYGWVGTSSGAVVLSDAGGNCRDLVVFGTQGVAIPTQAGSATFTNPLDRSSNNASIHDAMWRHVTLDTDDGQDWTNGADTQETPGSLNPGQVIGVIDVATVVLDDQAPALLNLNLSAGTFTATALVKHWVSANGLVVADGNVDGLVGGTLAMSGHFGGGNPATLDGMVFSPSLVTLTTATANDVLTIQTVLSTSNWTGHELGGGFGAAPLAKREMRSPSSNFVTRTGGGSPALSNLLGALGSQSFSLVVRLDAAGPRLVALEKNFTPAAGAFAAAIATNGLGAVEVGVVNAPGAEIWNLFSVNPVTPLGFGPVFGIEMSALVQAAIGMPLGVQPFHVAASAWGTYVYRTPNGVAYPGLVVQHVAVKLQGGVVTAAPARQIIF